MIEFETLNNNFNQTEADLQDKLNLSYLFAYISVSMHIFATMIGSLIVIVVLFFFRKRKDQILVCVAILYLLSSILFVPYLIFSWARSAPSFRSFLQNWPVYVSYFFSVFSYFMAHFIFAIQYLKTSVTLPKLFTQAKVEWIED